MKNPLVSLVIPTYNQNAVLRRAVESALAQNYKPLEIIVCDDASPQPLPLELKKFFDENQIRYHRHEKNLGRVANYRFTIYELVTGEWFLNLDGDDFLTNPDYIAKAVQRAQQDSEIKLVFGRQNYRSEETGQQWSQKSLDKPEIFDGTDFLIHMGKVDDGIPNLSALIHTDHARQRQVQSVDCIASDTESLLRILPGIKVGFLNEVAGVWNMNSTNASGSVDYKKRLTHYEIIDSPTAFFRQKNLLTESQIKKFRYFMVSRVFNDDVFIFLEHRSYSALLSYLKFSLEKAGLFVYVKLLLNWRFWVKLLIPGLLPKLKALLMQTHGKRY